MLLFRIKIYSLADSVGTKRNCMWREGRNVALVSAKLIMSIFAFSTNFRNSEWRLSSAEESTNTMIIIHTTQILLCAVHTQLNKKAVIFVCLNVPFVTLLHRFHAKMVLEIYSS
jgi:hypothetical protein